MNKGPSIVLAPTMHWLTGVYIGLGVDLGTVPHPPYRGPHHWSFHCFTLLNFRAYLHYTVRKQTCIGCLSPPPTLTSDPYQKGKSVSIHPQEDLMINASSLPLIYTT